MGHRQGDSSVYVRYHIISYVQLQRCRLSAYLFRERISTRHDPPSRLLRHAETRGQPGLETRHQPGPETCEVPPKANSCTWETWTLRLFRKDSCRGNRFGEFLRVFANFCNSLRCNTTVTRRKRREWVGNLRTQRFERTIRDFYSLVHAEEVDRQLKGIKPLDMV